MCVRLILSLTVASVAARIQARSTAETGRANLHDLDLQTNFKVWSWNGTNTSPNTADTLLNKMEGKSENEGKHTSEFSRRRRRIGQPTDSLIRQSTQKDEAQSVLDLLNLGEKWTNFASHTHAVIVLGNTGSGKSTFTHFITGNSQHLISQETEADTGDFTIRDISGKSIGNATTVSFTTFPEEIVEAKTKTVFYDCPGFSDTRDLAHNIASTYFTTRAINRCEKVKLVFTVNYSSLRVGENRLDFILMIRHVTSMIKNIGKFKDSIALVVTKVDNHFTAAGKLVSDEKLIGKIAKFLEQVRDELKTTISQDTSKQFDQRAVDFIDMLLERKDGEYRKIGIFRRPDSPGPLNDIPALQKGKQQIQKIIYENCEYTERQDGDFGYTISSDSKNAIYDLVEKIKTTLAADTADVCSLIGKYYTAQEENSTDIQDLYKEYQTTYEALLLTKNCKTPIDFVKRIIAHIMDLQIDDSNLKQFRKSLSKYENYDHYLQFLTSFNEQKSLSASEWMQGFNDLVGKVDTSQIWYGFLNQLTSILSEYRVQKNIRQLIQKNSLEKIAKQNPEHALGNLEELLKPLLPEIEIIFSRVKYIKQDEMKFKKLCAVIDWVLKPSTKSSRNGHRLQVKGRIVKLSDVSKMLTHQVKSIEIFALEKLFIDDDLNLANRAAQVVIIAPTWDIQGHHRITLDGASGEAHNITKAENGMYRRDGIDGNPGKPGQSAGRFFGVGNVILSSQNLVISANGGRGGPGQNGGNGADGQDSSYKSSDGCTVQCTVFIFTTTKCSYSGNSCTDGTNGGNGGAGGRGGKSGQISLVALNGGAKAILHHAVGGEGANGEGGSGGRGGAVLRQESNRDYFLIFKINENYHSDEKVAYCNNGNAGYGLNYAGIPNPKAVAFRPNNMSVSDFANFAKEASIESIRAASLAKFLKDLKSDESIATLS